MGFTRDKTVLEVLKQNFHILLFIQGWAAVSYAYDVELNTIEIMKVQDKITI